MNVADSYHPEEARLRPLFMHADSLREAMQTSAADTAYRRLEETFKAQADTAGMWRARLWLVDVQMQQGELDSAHAFAEGADDLTMNDLRRAAWVRVMRSRVLFREGRLPEAAELAEEARDDAPDNDHQLQSAIYHQLGRVYSLQGRHREALAVHEQSLTFLREINAQPSAFASALNEIGIDYRRLGRYDDARRAYEDALATHRHTGDKYWIAVVQYNLSNILRSVGDKPGALDALRESLELNRGMGNARGLAFAHLALASLNAELENVAQARSHFDSATAWNETAHHTFGVMGTLEDRARLELTEGEYAAAESLLHRALRLADSATFGTYQATVRDAFARLRIRQQRSLDAVRFARRAAAIADGLDDPAIEIQTLETLAASLEVSGDVDAALETYKQTIDLLESWRGRLTLGDLRRGISDRRLGAYEGAIRLLTARGDVVGAFEVAERTRARFLLELMAIHPDRADIDPAIDSLRVRIEEAFAARSALDGIEREAADHSIESMTDSLIQLEQLARTEHPVAGAARYPRPSSNATLQTVLLQPGRTLLSYFWGEEDVYGWRVSPSGIRGASLGHPDDIRNLIDFVRRALFASDDADIPWHKAARRAYDLLIAPLEPEPGDQLLVVPSGALTGLPFEVMISPADVSLGASASVVYGPSAAVLETLVATPLPEDRWDRGVLAVGNPHLVGDTLGTLPYAEAEARAVSQLGDAEGTVLVGRRATVKRWLQTEPARYRYLHFGAHAVVDEQRISATHIRMSDEPLRLSTIQRTPLTAELVTLSACETGLGRDLGGEGIVGLVHAFLAAGARGALVTLWKVPDQTAHDFTVSFYRELAQGADPATAMYTVKRLWIGAGRPAADWAGFVLVGGLRGVSPSAGGNTL